MYLPIKIDEYGFIRAMGHGKFAGGGYEHVVHRETRDMHHEYVCSPTLGEARERLTSLHCNAVLRLTPDGGGAAICVPTSFKDEAASRVNRFRSCYGSWSLMGWKED